MLAIKVRSSVNVLLGFTPLLISFFWALVINLYSLSPNDCKFMVPFSLSCATIFAIIIGVGTLVNDRK